MKLAGTIKYPAKFPDYPAGKKEHPPPAYVPLGSLYTAPSGPATLEEKQTDKFINLLQSRTEDLISIGRDKPANAEVMDDNNILNEENVVLKLHNEMKVIERDFANKRLLRERKTDLMNASKVLKSLRNILLVSKDDNFASDIRDVLRSYRGNSSKSLTNPQNPSYSELCELIVEKAGLGGMSGTLTESVRRFANSSDDDKKSMAMGVDVIMIDITHSNCFKKGFCSPSSGFSNNLPRNSPPSVLKGAGHSPTRLNRGFYSSSSTVVNRAMGSEFGMTVQEVEKEIRNALQLIVGACSIEGRVIRRNGVNLSNSSSRYGLGEVCHPFDYIYESGEWPAYLPKVVCRIPMSMPIDGKLIDLLSDVIVQKKNKENNSNIREEKDLHSDSETPKKKTLNSLSIAKSSDFTNERKVLLGKDAIRRALIACACGVEFSKF
eukprot:GDKJ01023875.1.p1 GENE.GDKJ01023875.1~~GDKJ01023875.1.p1  ORF type:complete len:485 (+),score=97.89 GDKJ01023875.1:153-1457(+)